VCAPGPLRDLCARYPWLKVKHTREVDIHPSAIHWINASLDAMALSFRDGWQYVVDCKNPDRHVSSARRGVQALVRFLNRRSREGVKGTKSIKALTNWWRRISIDDLLEGTNRPPALPDLGIYFRGCLSLSGYSSSERRRILFQMSRMGRAGGLPLMEQKQSALVDHITDLTRTGLRLVRRDLVSLHRFTCRWAHGKTDGLLLKFPTSKASTFGSSVEAGGLVEEVRVAVAALVSRTMTKRLQAQIVEVCGILPYHPFKEGLSLQTVPLFGEEQRGVKVGDVLFPYLGAVGPQEWEYLRPHLLSYVAMAMRMANLLQRCKKKGDLPLARQCVVEERGQKTRVVTPVSGCASYMAMFINTILLYLLERDPRTKSTKNTHASDLCPLLIGASDLFLRSVDMQRATDLIPHEVAQTICRGLQKVLDLPPFIYNSLLLLNGPFRMWTDGGFIDTTSGILMGVGSSWPILSLYNLWLWDGAWAEAGMRNSSKFLVRRMVRVIGDDLLGLAPLAVSQAYTARLVRTGGKPSPGKDLLSVTHGVLGEELVTLYPPDGGAPQGGEGSEGLRVTRFDVSYAHVVPTYSIRALQPQPGFDRDGSSPNCAGPQLSREWDRAGRPLWMLAFLRARWATVYRGLRKVGLNPELPREFGGGGFPTDSVRSCIGSLRPQWVRALRCAMSQGKNSYRLLSRMNGCWAERKESLVPEWEQDFWRRAQKDSLPEPGWRLEGSEIGDNPTILQVLELCPAIASATARLTSSASEIRVSSEPWAIKLRVVGVREALNALVPYPHLTDKPNDIEKGIVAFLGVLRQEVPRHFHLPLVGCMSALSGPHNPRPVVSDLDLLLRGELSGLDFPEDLLLFLD
jgi:hypothetical protein